MFDVYWDGDEEPDDKPPITWEIEANSLVHVSRFEGGFRLCCSRYSISGLESRTNQIIMMSPKMKIDRVLAACYCHS